MKKRRWIAVERNPRHPWKTMDNHADGVILEWVSRWIRGDSAARQWNIQLLTERMIHITQHDREIIWIREDLLR